MLDALDAHDPAGREDFVRRLAAAPEDGAIKLWVTSRGLRFRRCHRELFARGAYYPVRTAGGTQGHVVAFARRAGEQTAIAAAARFFLRLKSPGPLPVGPEVWGDSVLVLPSGVPPGTYRDVLTGRRVESARRKSAHVLPLAEVFGTLTAVLLERVTPEFPAR
jgi:(1->4)-alpha-D-glucan 1-alpha-D-glucosylmutase